MTSFVNIHTHKFTGRHIEVNAVGVHPWSAKDADTSEICDNMFYDAEAIGEIGLDCACDVDIARQTELFCRQLEIAQRLQKPVIIHCVKAFEPTINLLLKYSLKAVVFHGFIGSKEQAAKALLQGYFLSFGHRLFRSPKSIEAMRSTPLSQMFIETDESDQTIEDMYDAIATLRGISTEELAVALLDNWSGIFEKK